MRIRRNPEGCRCVGVKTAKMNGHRLIFEVSKLEGNQHDDRSRQCASARPGRGQPGRGESGSASQ